MEQLSAEKFKELGNEAFSKGNYQEAIDLYTKGLETTDDSKLNVIFYKNRAMTKLKIDDFEGSESDCSKGILKINK